MSEKEEKTTDASAPDLNNTADMAGNQADTLSDPTKALGNPADTLGNVTEVAGNVPGADAALAVAPGGEAIKAAMDIASMMIPEKVPPPNMGLFEKAMKYENIQPIIDRKIMADELFQEPEKDNNGLDPDNKDLSTNKNKDQPSNTESCKQQNGGNPLEDSIIPIDLELTRLKECIESKLDCKHIKELIVKNFEKFIDKKVVHSHFHSVSKKTNNLDTMSIFYRHGLSKIVSKIMHDVKNNPEILKFFLDEMMENIETMEDEKLMEYIYGFDNNLIFDLVNDENIKKLADENVKNKDKMCRLLVELYPESEFNILINDLMVNKQITREDMQKWRTVYNDFQFKEKIKEEVTRKEENALLDKIGVNNALELFGLTPKKNELSDMNIEFVNSFTKYDEKMGGKKKKTVKRKTIKRKTPSK